ncbi:MAG: hypothetical protein AB1742_15670 [bacterium]
MDANVKVLVDATGCTETEAQSVLSAAKNDISKALQMLESQAREMMLFNAHFFSKGPAAAHGYLTFIVNLNNDNVVYSDLVYPLAAQQAEPLNVNMPPTVIASTVHSLKENIAERHRASSRSNLAQFRTRLTTPLVRSLLGDARAARADRVNEQFKKILDAMYGEDFEIEHGARAYSAQAIAPLLKKTAEAATPEERAAKLFEKEDAETAPALSDEIPPTSPQEPLPKIVLICEPEISPFTGKPAKELNVSDEIVVKIKDTRESARYFSELLGGVVGDELVPLMVPLVRISAMSETFVEGFVEFGPGIYGEFFIPPDVKIKTAEEDIEVFDPFENELSLLAEERFGRHIMAGLILLIVSTIALIFIFWGYS